ncbi:MAG: enoyl-CoA hydratase/isomerase family protein [Dehalococcoidales bacterium]|nr:enoyl-CoA hydratase/isomerase family protein [Dehalococcoidales bacterium]
MQRDIVLYEKKDKVAYITLNRPEKRNAVNMEVMGRLNALFTAILNDQDVRVVILTGSGTTAFSAGADIADPQVHSTASVGEYLESGANNYFPRQKIPVIAAVNGYCYGAGLEIALCCDIIIASDKAQFGLQHVRWGIYAAGGGARRLAALAGKTQAMYYTLTGESFDAQQALAMGVVSKVVPHEQLMRSAEETARLIAQWSPLVVRFTKDCICEAVEQSLQQLDQTDKFRVFTLFSTQDREEANRAFTEKRAPIYKGK